MGGAVSSGRDNTELIDNLMGGNYIRTRDVERVFRALDRGDYMTPDARDQAYKDLAWRNGPLHMSAPCIYSEVMEGLELKPGLTFLNVGSGTGYLSTLVGLILGSSGINHGVEIYPNVVEYATKKLTQFMESSPTLDEFDFCEPKFLCGNGLCLAPLQAPYDRVYCGAGCPEEYQNYFQQLIKVGGILIMPLNDNLLQVKRTGPTEWQTRSLLNVSFASLRVPTKEEYAELIRLEEQTPSRLQALARSVIRSRMRGAMRRRHPAVREPPPRAPPAKRVCPRRICIPVDDDDSEAETLNRLHDLDRASGAHEMNALLSLVLSMGHNRVAGALRVEPRDSDSDSSEDLARQERPEEDGNESTGSGMLMFEFLDSNSVVRNGNAPTRRPRLRRRRPRDSDRDTNGDGETDEDDRESDGEDRETDRDEREPNRETEQTDKEQNHAQGDHVDPAESKELENESNNEEVATDNKEVKCKNTDDMEEIPLADKEVALEVKDTDNMEEIPLADKEVALEVKECTSKDKEAKKDINSKLIKTLNEKEVENPLKDTSDDIDVDSASGEDSISESKQPTSQHSLEEKTAQDNQFSDHSDCSEKETRLKRSSRKARDASSKSRSRLRSSRSSRDDDGQKNPEVPVEVEICLGKEAAGPSTMEWENSEPIDAEAKQRSSGDEVIETEMSKVKEEKRHKLDSGIGENSPSGGSGSHNSGGSDESRSDTDEDEGCDEDVRGRRRRQKRGHLSTRSSSSTDEDSCRQGPRPRRPRTDHDAARRAQLALLMKRAVKELPLPHALQLYVNLGRCLEF